MTLLYITGDLNVATALEMSNVDQLYSMGIKGASVKIVIINTEVDYIHPSLGGCFGPRYKVSFGYAFVDDDSNSIRSPDPLATCITGGHGTYVTGITGIEDPKGAGFGLVRVAPKATLGIYRVWGCRCWPI